MFHFEKAEYISQLIPGYQYLCSNLGSAHLSPWLQKNSYGCNADSVREVELAISNGISTNDIYFTRHHKQPEQLEPVIGKCRLVTGNLEEMQLIDEITAKNLTSGHLEVIGIHVIPDDYNDGKQYGFRVSELAGLAASFRKLQHLSIRGCFIEGNISALQGKDLQRHFRRCYETAKQVTTALPCGMSYISFGACTDSLYKSAVEEKDFLPDICQTAGIVRHQNDTAFYARLLIL